MNKKVIGGLALTGGLFVIISSISSSESQTDMPLVGGSGGGYTLGSSEPSGSDELSSPTYNIYQQPSESQVLTSASEPTTTKKQRSSSSSSSNKSSFRPRATNNDLNVRASGRVTSAKIDNVRQSTGGLSNTDKTLAKIGISPPSTPIVSTTKKEKSASEKVREATGGTSNADRTLRKIGL